MCVSYVKETRESFELFSSLSSPSRGNNLEIKITYYFRLITRLMKLCLDPSRCFFSGMQLYTETKNKYFQKLMRDENRQPYSLKLLFWYVKLDHSFLLLSTHAYSFQHYLYSIYGQYLTLNVNVMISLDDHKLYIKKQKIYFRV